MAVRSCSVYRFCALFRGCFAGFEGFFKPSKVTERPFGNTKSIVSVLLSSSHPFDSLGWCRRLHSSGGMAPKGRSVKAKDQTEENGKEKRTRNVKATSYKEQSDSEDEVKRGKSSSEEESNSEDEKPIKKRGPKKKITPRRKTKGASESESDYRSSEGDSDEETTRKRRKPVRSLRARKSTPYKDLSNSEDDSESFSPQTSGKQNRKRQKKSEKTSSKEETSPGSGNKSDESDKDKSGESPDKGSDSETKETPGDADDSAEKKNITEASSDEEESKKSVKNKETKDPPVKSGKDSEKEDAISDTSEGKISKKSNVSERPEHDLSDEEETEKIESMPKKRGRAKKTDGSEQSSKKPKLQDDPPKLNRTDSDYDSIDFSSTATTSDGKMWNLKVSSWNVAGLKAWLKKCGLDFIKYEQPDILCLQETKCSEKKLPPEAKVEGYHCYWHSGDKEGYAGVALLSKQEPLNVKYGIDVEKFDSDGRVITAEFENFFLVNAYVPNAGQGLKTLPHRLEWDPAFRAYLKKLDEKKPVVLCGDLNVAHAEIDLKNPKTNTKSAGFTPQERDGMTELLKEGFVDSFRHLYPDKTDAYSFWAYFNQARSRNIGWRLDYFILSERLLPNLCDNVIRSEVYGSDHCPITLFVNF